MSKKPQKNQTNPKKPQIVDQQNEPFLRAISKRVRNINKKIQEIIDLQKKGQQLKPEQIEKINRKSEYEQQREKLENIADFFRQVYSENVEQYRNNQLQQLDNLAQAVAVLRSNANFKEADKLSELNRAFTQPSNLSVADNSKYVSEVFRRFANDHKLKKSLNSFVTEVQPQQNQQQKPQPVVTKEEPVQQTKVQQPRQVPVVQAPVQVKTEPVVVEAPTQKQQTVETEKPQQVPSTQAQEVVAEQKQQGQQTAQNGEQKPPRQQNRTRGQYRNPRNNNRGPRVQGQQGGYRKEGGQRRRYENNNQERRQRPNYRPKDNQPQQARQDSDDSSLQEEVVRQFKRDQVKELVEQGFTVVGKPKPKAKEGQKQWHEHTHGRKDHHGHHKGNK